MDEDYINYLATIVEDSEDAIIIKSLDGNIVNWNKGSEKMFGYTAKEMIGKNISLIVPIEFIEEDKNNLRTISNNEMVDCYETIRIHKNGEQMNVLLIVFDFKDSTGKVIRSCQVARDIISKKKSDSTAIEANKALVASENRYRRLFEAAQDGILILNADTGRIEDVNPFMMEMLGYSYSEFLGKELWEIGLFSDINANKEAFLKLKEEGYIRYKDLPLKTKNGLAISVEFVSNRYDVSDGQVIQCNIREITERKIAEEKNKLLTERLQVATQSAKLGIWDWDIKNNILNWDAGMYLLYDIDEVEFKSVYDGWLSRIHPEDIERVNHTMQQALVGKEDYSPIFRLVWKDSSVHYVEASGLIERDAQGNAIRMIGANWDVTENVNMLKNIEAKEQFNKAVIESSPDCLKILDNDGRLLYMNFNGLCQMEIDDFSDFKNKHWWLLWGPENETMVKESLEKAMKGEKAQFSALCPTAKGTPKWWDVSVYPVSKSGEPIQNIISVSRDITAKKVEEQRLKLLESVITHTKDSVMITEAEPFDEPGNRIIYVNEAFTKMTGYSSEEVIGKTPRILQGPKSDKIELKRLSKAIRKWQSFETTIINYKKNGEAFWINFSLTPVANEKGWYTHWIAIERDVTDSINHIIAIEDQNTKLKEIAWTQSHIVRAPLARMLGIVNLLKDINMDSKEYSEWLKIFIHSASELDETIKDITNKAQAVLVD